LNKKQQFCRIEAQKWAKFGVKNNNIFKVIESRGGDADPRAGRGAGGRRADAETACGLNRRPRIGPADTARLANRLRRLTSRRSHARRRSRDASTRYCRCKVYAVRAAPATGVAPRGASPQPPA
jgi:hypothetical protein